MNTDIFYCNIILLDFSVKVVFVKVLLLNGSPHERGCTYTALSIVAKALNDEGIETEIFYAGKDAISPCKACNACRKTGKCVIDDKVNEFNQKAEDADGFIFGSPVHYASASGILTTFLDRAFYAGASKNIYRMKPGAAVASARRAGTTATLDQINKYFTITEMPIVSSRYWNMVHGSNPEQVMQDEEGVQIMKILGKNMAWYLKSMDAAKKAGIMPPEKEEVTYTNFIR